MGKAMRAVSVDSDAAQLMGINVNRTISFTFALGSALAGAAGVLIALYYNSLEPLMGVTPGLKSFRCRSTWWYRNYSWCGSWWLCDWSIGNLCDSLWNVRLP